MRKFSLESVTEPVLPFVESKLAQVPPFRVFEPGTRAPGNLYRGMIAPPFLVPALLDAISKSKYAAVTEVVPDEADSYCAKAAQENGGVVLSNDSDYFAHDLGMTGGFGFLYQAELRTNDEKAVDGVTEPCDILRLSVYFPREIAERLDLADLCRLAYIFKKENKGGSIKLPEAIVRAQKVGEHEDAQFQVFQAEYLEEPGLSKSHDIIPVDLSYSGKSLMLLDPRVSEFVLQVALTTKDAVSVYLPFLIDDPSRFSAWRVSSEQRAFAYSICTIYCKRPANDIKTTVEEFKRNGQAIAAQHVTLIPENDLLFHGNRLRIELQHFHSSFSQFPSNIIWRSYALYEVYRWYLNDDRTPPTRETMKRAMISSSQGLRWEDTHLSVSYPFETVSFFEDRVFSNIRKIQALLESALYTLRMMEQILVFVVATATKLLPQELKDLATLLETLPPIAELMPSRFEIAAQASEFDVDELLDTLAGILQAEVDRSDDVQAIDGGGDEDGTQ